MAALREEGLRDALGVAPGPANGFTLDVIDCLERFGDADRLGDGDPQPARAVARASSCSRPPRRHGVRVITRVVDYGGLFHDDVRPGHEFAERDHRAFRPAGWIEAGRERLERMRPIAERHGLTLLQLACAWNLAHAPVACVAPTLIQEAGADARADRGQARRARRASRREVVLDGRGGRGAPRDRRQHRLMALKGASPDHDGEPRPDRWPLDDELRELAARWGIDPARDLVKTA